MGVAHQQPSEKKKKKISIKYLTRTTYIALYISYAKVTCNTHTNNEIGFHPSNARSLISLTTTPLFTPFHRESRLQTPKLVIPVFGAVLSTSLDVALLTFVRSLSVYGVKVTGVYYDFSIEFSCISVHIITYYIYVFYRENRGGG